MSKIDKLLISLCPNGVEYRKLKEILCYQRSDKYIVESTTYEDSFKTPVLTAGNTFILGYTNEVNGIYRASKEKPVIIFDDFTTSFHWVDFPFKVKSSAMKILTPQEGINFRFVYFAMKCIMYTPSNHARQWISVYSDFSVPAPPIEVQREIVRILDKFAKLEAELEARKKQYEYYRNSLFSFESLERER
ncbi:MAG: restriction endonuclease subunit S [Holosporales bacterium]|jgi:type I restriction enzyme S subunit|nr:restriction endonuclease subunit S [Holosporales bacterium]